LNPLALAISTEAISLSSLTKTSAQGSPPIWRDDTRNQSLNTSTLLDSLCDNHSIAFLTFSSEISTLTEASKEDLVLDYFDSSPTYD